jgi:hypothetical protein
MNQVSLLDVTETSQLTEIVLKMKRGEDMITFYQQDI